MGACFGCCFSSSTAWETAATEGWPTYTLQRHYAGASRYSLEISKGSKSILTISVQLYLTPQGRVHAGAVHPSTVTFSGGGATGISYDASKKILSNDHHSFKRQIGTSYHLCAYDTVWRKQGGGDVAATSSSTGPLLPHELSVVNNEGRVAAFRGVHLGAWLPDKATRSADLLARVPDTTGEWHNDEECRVFELCLHPALETAAGAEPGALPLLLAIISEGFWSQGAICHGGKESDDTHGGETDQDALLAAGRHGKHVLRPTGLPMFNRHRAKAGRQAAAKMGGGKSRAQVVDVEMGRV